jgi:hypothetical protein
VPVSGGVYLHPGRGPDTQVNETSR